MKKEGIWEKRGQMHLPFGMIFAIILIAVFLVVAVIAIRYFLNWQKCGQVGLFYEDLQQEVDNVWESQSTKGQVFSAPLPNGIEYVCFADLSREASVDDKIHREIYNDLKKNVIYGHNIFLWPKKRACEMASREIKHIDVEEIISEKNPYCVKNNGKVRFKLEKGFYDDLVGIS